MRARWALLIAGGVLVLAVVLLFIRPRPERVMVSMLYETNKPNVYLVSVGNMARRPYVFTAWTEYQTNGAWRLVTPHKHGGTLKPSQVDTFTLPKPEHNKARIAVMYNRVTGEGWEHWRDALRALAGFYPKAGKMYIDAP